MSKKKKTLLIIKIAGMEPIDARKTDGWTAKEIGQFIKGVKSGHPKAKVTYSTISGEHTN